LVIFLPWFGDFIDFKFALVSFLTTQQPKMSFTLILSV
jgi:hypothetical protein